MNNKKKFIFDKETTAYIKGVAIVMMIVHHFFAFPEWQLKEDMYISLLRIGGVPAELLLGRLCKLCVCIFAFISGYGLFFALAKREPADRLRYCLKKAAGLVLMYWMALILFVAPVFLFFGKFSLGMFIRNLLLYDYSMIYSGWYVLFYIEMLGFVFIYGFLKIKNGLLDAALIFGLSLILNSLVPEVPLAHYFLPFMIGYVFSKYALYERFERIMKNEAPRYAVSFLLLGVLVGVRLLLGDVILRTPTVSFIAPVLCYDLAVVVRFIVGWGPIKMLLAYLSKYCTWYWFLHVVFHSGIYPVQAVGYLPRVSVLVVIWVFAVLMPFVVVLNAVMGALRGRFLRIASKEAIF